MGRSRDSLRAVATKQAVASTRGAWRRRGRWRTPAAAAAPQAEHAYDSEAHGNGRGPHLKTIRTPDSCFTDVDEGDRSAAPSGRGALRERLQRARRGFVQQPPRIARVRTIAPSAPGLRPTRPFGPARRACSLVRKSSSAWSGSRCARRALLHDREAELRGARVLSGGVCRCDHERVATQPELRRM
jgi:hypothetical protein